MRRRSASIFAENHEEFIKKFTQDLDIDETIQGGNSRKKSKSKSSMMIKEVFLEEYENSALNFNKDYNFEILVPSLEDRISTDECEIYENINKINFKIKNEREICLKLLNDINENKELDMENIFDQISETLSIDKSKITSGDDLKKFICENFELSEKHLKFLFVGNKNAGKTSVLNYIKSLYQEKSNNKFYECTPTTCLDISKIYLPIENHLLRIELWDSNTTIQNSKIFETDLKLCNVFIFIYRKDDLMSYENLEKFITKVQNINPNLQIKKTLIICNDLAIDDILLNKFDEKSNDKYKKQVNSQENLIKNLIDKFNFTECNLSDLNTKFLQDFLMDFI